jgi:hypothetical protein
VTALYFSPDGDGVQDDTSVVYRTDASAPVSVQVSDARGRLVRTLGQELPAQGSVTWDGRDDGGRLLWDGPYTITVRSGGVQGRATVILDTNRSPIHDAAGTGMVALTTLDSGGVNVGSPAWMPAEDELVLIVPVGQQGTGFEQGLLRWRLDGTRTYVALRIE